MIYDNAKDSDLMGKYITILTKDKILYSDLVSSASSVSVLRKCLGRISGFPMTICPDGYFIVIEVSNESQSTGRVVLNRAFSSIKVAQTGSNAIGKRKAEPCVVKYSKITPNKPYQVLVAEYKEQIGWA